MKKGALIQIVVALAVLMVVIGGAACSKPSPTATDGIKPVYDEGDCWVWKRMRAGNTFIEIDRIVGQETLQGHDSYILEVSYDPPYMGGVSSETRWYDKDTLYCIQRHELGESDGTPYTIDINISYDFKGVSPWPLKVGKEFDMVESTFTTYTMEGEPQTTPRLRRLVVRVEELEEITIPAGTFNCLRVTVSQYGDEEVLMTSWYSSEAKNYIKRIYHNIDETTEVVCYSLGGGR